MTITPTRWLSRKLYLSGSRNVAIKFTGSNQATFISIRIGDSHFTGGVAISGNISCPMILPATGGTLDVKPAMLHGPEPDDDLKLGSREVLIETFLAAAAGRDFYSSDSLLQPA